MVGSKRFCITLKKPLHEWLFNFDFVYCYSSVEKFSTVFILFTEYISPVFFTVSSNVAGDTLDSSYSTIAIFLLKSTVADLTPSIFASFLSIVFAQPMAQVIPSIRNSAFA